MLRLLQAIRGKNHYHMIYIIPREFWVMRTALMPMHSSWLTDVVGRCNEFGRNNEELTGSPLIVTDWIS